MEGYIYFLRDDRGFIKIGFTFDENPKVRQWGCQVGNSQQLEMIAYFKTSYPDMVEKDLHREFWKYKTRPDKNTGEWFHLPDDFLNNNFFKTKQMIYANETIQIPTPGHAAHYVRPLPRRQQYPTPGDGEVLYRSGRQRGVADLKPDESFGK